MEIGVIIILAMILWTVYLISSPYWVPKLRNLEEDIKVNEEKRRLREQFREKEKLWDFERKYEKIKEEKKKERKRRSEVINNEVIRKIDDLIQIEFGQIEKIHEDQPFSFLGLPPYIKIRILPFKYENQVNDITKEWSSNQFIVDNEFNLDDNSQIFRLSYYLELRKKKLSENKIFKNSNDNLAITEHPKPSSYAIGTQFYFNGITEPTEWQRKRFFKFVNQAHKFSIHEDYTSRVVVVKPTISKTEFLDLSKDSLFISDLIKKDLVFSFNNYIYYWLERGIMILNDKFILEAMGNYFVPSKIDPNIPRMKGYCYNYYENYKLKSFGLTPEMIEKELDILYNSGIKDIYKNHTIKSQPDDFVQTTVFFARPNFYASTNHIEPSLYER